MNTKIKQLLPDIVCVALFAVIALIYFYPSYIDGRRLEQHDNGASTGLSVEINQYRDAHDGETPRWTNSIFGGMPTFQIAPSYDSLKPLSAAEKIYSLGLPDYVFYVFILMLGFYILLRAFNFREWMAALGAVVWAFSSYFFIIIAAGHIWKVLTLAYIPPTIAGIVLCYKGKYLYGGVVTAIFAALQILSNHVQMTYYFLIPELLIVVAFLADAIRKKQTSRFIKGTATLAIAATVAVCMNISNLYHTYKYAEDTMRGKSELVKHGQTDNQTDSGLERSYITAWSYGKGETWSLLIPNIHGGASVPLSMSATAMKKADSQFTNAGIYGAFTQYWGEQPGTSGPVYAGALVCMLFVLSLFILPNRNPLKWALLLATLLSFMLAWGKNFMGLTDWFIDNVPMYAKFRTVSSILVVAEFTIPLLAMMALKEFVEGATDSSRRPYLLRALTASTAITAGICLLFAVAHESILGDCLSSADRNAMAQYIEKGYFDRIMADNIMASLNTMRGAMLSADAWRSMFIILLGAVLMYWYFKNSGKLLAENKLVKSKGYDDNGKAAVKLPAAILCIALLLISLIDMWVVNKRYLNDSMFVYPRGVQAIEKTDADQYILEKSGSGRDYRVLNFTVSTFNDNTTSAFYSSIGGYHAAKLRRYQELVEEHLSKEMGNVYTALNMAGMDTVRMMQENLRYPVFKFETVNCDSLFPVLNMLNTRWFILGGGQDGRTKLPVENPTAMGNAWFVDNVKFVDNANEELDALHTCNPRHTAVIDNKFKTQTGNTDLKKDSTATVRLTQYDATHAVYETDSKHGGLVVFSEIYYPEWEATIDGTPAEIVRADYVLRAIRVPSGKHTIEMVFDPQSIHTTETAAYIALSVLIATVAILLIRYFMKK
ncbi:MAG: YfhO family protein [Bacteroides sp.]|nr:YfhO family protein [Roseburia sp.]MCM1347479.1 YfhO family protein [Bacteroides sp.]MCM1421966.1 YfhO family protein [Bacteroides sp.]